MFHDADAMEELSEEVFDDTPFSQDWYVEYRDTWKCQGLISVES